LALPGDFTQGGLALRFRNLGLRNHLRIRTSPSAWVEQQAERQESMAVQLAPAPW